MEPKTARRLDTKQVHPEHGTTDVVCNADSLILTLAGEIRVSNVQVGGKVITRDSGTARVLRITQSAVTCDAVAIKAGSLGHRRPPEDALLPATSRILIRDWRAQALCGRTQMIAQARRLCDNEYIRLVPDHRFDLVTLHFDKPHILYVAGLELACGTLG